MKIVRTKTFTKMYLKLDRKIQDKTDETIFSFVKNPFDKKLRNHKLNWIYQECRSVDVTWDYRIIFKELSDDMYELVELLKVWTHSQLY